MIECKNFEELSGYLEKIESLYRVGKENEANWNFNMAALAIENFLTKSNITPDKHLGNLLNVMLDAQHRRDYLFFADILKYELLPHINSLSS